MNGAISCHEYVDLLRTDYLRSYLPDGGSTVKVVLAGEDGRKAFIESLTGSATDLGYLCVSVDSATTRIYKLEEVWFSIARQIDWLETARQFLKAALFPRFDIDTNNLTIDSIAAKNGLERWMVRRTIDEVLHRRLIRRKGLSGEYRRAMFNLVGSLLAPTGLVADATPYVLSWLRGELASIVPAKRAMLYRKITKNNARQLLTSLPRWLRDCRLPGLVLMVDVAAITAAKKPGMSLNYWRPAAIDCYEVIRQFIDSIDSIAGFGLWFVGEPGFADDERHGMHIYPALEMRLAQDTHDVSRGNPFASLVRLS